LATIGLGAAMLAFAGCGVGGGATTAQRSTPPATTKPTGTTGAGGAAVTIRESEFKLDPANPKVKAGTVTFEAMNTGTVVHALEVEGKGLEVKTGNIQPGQSHRFPSAHRCPIVKGRSDSNPLATTPATAHGRRVHL
jgi:plastocyanin